MKTKLNWFKASAGLALALGANSVTAQLIRIEKGNRRDQIRDFGNQKDASRIDR